MQSLIEAVVQELRKLEPESFLALFAADGDGRVRQAAGRIFGTHHARDFGELLDYDELAELVLLDLECGYGALVLDVDFRHLIKRLASVLRRAAGIRIGNVCISTSQLNVILRETDSTLTRADANKLLSPHDKMNVRVSTALAGRISSAADYYADPSTPLPATIIERGRRQAVTVLGALYRAYCDAYFHPRLDLPDQLENLSFVGGLNLVLYRAGGSEFCPVQLYHDLSSNIRSAFWLVARYQRSLPDDDVFLSQLGTDLLESLFGASRTQHHDRNLTALNAGERMQKSVQARRPAQSARKF
jgi:hypothetical protein